jgi:hypothetical protein
VAASVRLPFAEIAAFFASQGFIVHDNFVILAKSRENDGQ